MASIPIGGMSAPVTLPAFNPADWLARFKSVGGWWIVNADDKVSVGWRIAGFRDDQHDRARAMFSDIENAPGQRDAIRNHLIAEMGETDHG